jgi:inorganic pyrophosphatase
MNKARGFADTQRIDVLGVHLAVDKRNVPNLTSEPFLLAAFELGTIDDTFSKLTRDMYRAQERRWETTKELTAASEDSLDRALWFVYVSVAYQGRTWQCPKHSGKPSTNNCGFSTKAAVGWAALFGDSYSKLLERQSPISGVSRWIYRRRIPRWKAKHFAKHQHQRLDSGSYAVQAARPSCIPGDQKMSIHDHAIWRLLGLLYKPHPWHGVSPGDDLPNILQCFVEVVPSDTVKYEIDKMSGYLKLDRPQKYSSVCPALYGFVPQTLCAERIAEFSSERTGQDVEGDGDPLDICILTDRLIPHGNLIVDCIPIGGLRMVDQNEADDKIVAVLKNDATYGSITDIEQVPALVIDRLRHYFLSYKQHPDSDTPTCQITHVYGRDEAHKVISLSMEDYKERFGAIEEILSEALGAVR